MHKKNYKLLCIFTAALLILGIISYAFIPINIKDVFKNGYFEKLSVLSEPARNVWQEYLPREVVAGGNTVGVRINFDGVLITDINYIKLPSGRKTSPILNAGLRRGDNIETANGEKVKSISHLEQIAEKSGGKPVDIVFSRQEKKCKTNIIPVFDGNAFRFGAMAKDCAAGIGTVTFYDPKTKEFGALGHAVMESTTRNVIDVGSGDILSSTIIGVQKGERGAPGQLKGLFTPGNRIGNIEENNSFGIYGHISDETANDLSKKETMPIAQRSQVKTGTAYILSNINGQDVKRYEIEIQKIMPQAQNSNRAMVIKIKDPHLLKMTGGIVQGMSGSPIIQDDRLVGAVTHVFVNDPTRGFATLIENMLK